MNILKIFVARHFCILCQIYALRHIEEGWHYLARITLHSLESSGRAGHGGGGLSLTDWLTGGMLVAVLPPASSYSPHTQL